MFYSKSTGGFYSRRIHGNNMPLDVVEISEEDYLAVLDGQSKGLMIVGDSNGRPILQDRPTPTPGQISSLVTQARISAYATEADPLFFKWQRGEATQAEWLAKIEEIRARFPDGIMPVFHSL